MRGCVSSLCHKRDTPQYLSQIKSAIHETFSVFQDLSPELFNIVHAHACACMHAQRILTCMQLVAVNKLFHFS